MDTVFVDYLSDILFNCRGLMIAALTVGFVAILTTILGMKCVTIGGQNIKAKARVAFSGGLLFGVGGESTYRL